jgi:hypothetical protein
MGGNIQDAFGGIGPIYYQWQLPVLNLFSHRNDVSENYG